MSLTELVSVHLFLLLLCYI